MPLYLPCGLPCAAELRQAGLDVRVGAPEAGHRLMRLLFLNLMPLKPATELDFCRVLAPISEAEIELVPVRIAGQTYKNTPQAYVERYYTEFWQAAEAGADGLIITGAPIEHLAFEQVRYWPQLERIMSWADAHIRSTLYVCWGAQAGLYHHFGINKHLLPAKCFGIYTQRVLVPEAPLMEGLAPAFAMPHSRHTAIDSDAVRAERRLVALAAAPETGISLMQTPDARQVYVTGHLEYAAPTLDGEYRRDRAKGLPIALPQHYYRADDPAQGPAFTWQGAALRFYRNWVVRCAAAPSAS